MTDQTEQKKEYQQKMEDALKEMALKIDKLKQEAEQKGEEAREKLQSEIQDLENKRTTARERLNEVQSASAGAWEEFRRALDRAIEDLRFGIDQAAAHFKRL